MGNGVFMKEGNLFNGMEDNRCFEDGSIELLHGLCNQISSSVHSSVV